MGVTEDMRRNRLWYEKRLREIAMGEPKKVDKFENLVVEDWKCAPGADRFKSWEEFDKYMKAELGKVSERQYGRWKSGEQIEMW